TRHADHKHLKLPPGSMLHAARDVSDDAFGERDSFVIELHLALAADDVVNLVGDFVVVKFGVGDFEMVDFGGGLVLFFEQAANLAAGFNPRSDISAVAPDEGGGLIHSVWMFTTELPGVEQD